MENEVSRLKEQSFLGRHRGKLTGCDCEMEISESVRSRARELVTCSALCSSEEGDIGED